MQPVFSLIPAGWQVQPNGLSLKIVAPTHIEADCFARGARNGLTQLSKRLGVPIQIVADGSAIVEFGKLTAKTAEDLPMSEDHQNLLWFAQISVSPALLRIANELMANPSKTGVVRLSDELQVIMNDGCSVLNPGHTLTEATTWTQDQFWHPDDLEAMRAQSRQESMFEFTWRSFDPTLGMHDHTPGNWLEFSTRYRLVDGQNGEFYQVCENLGMREIAPVL
jgi:hypothetical protein